MVLGDIGGSRLSIRRTRRGTQFLAGEALERLIEPFEDIQMGGRDQVYAHKSK